MKNNTVFLSENFQFLEMNFFIYSNRRVFVMETGAILSLQQPFFAFKLALVQISQGINGEGIEMLHCKWERVESGKRHV